MNTELIDIQDAAWRECRIDWDNTDEERDKLKDDVMKYKPLDDFLYGGISFPSVNILLFGGIGGGRSSIVNTWMSVFQNKIFNVAISGSNLHVLTKKLTKYPIIPVPSTHSRISPLRFRVWDTRGLEPKHLMTTENMKFLLQGNIPDKYPFDPAGNISTDMPGFNRNPRLDEKIHCVAIVQDCSSLDALPDNIPYVFGNIQKMRTVINTQDVPQVMILTNIDKVSMETFEDTSKAYYSSKIKGCVATASELFGLPKNVIYPMRNYEYETETDSCIDTLALLALKCTLNACDGHLFNHIDDIYRLYNVEDSMPQH